MAPTLSSKKTPAVTSDAASEITLVNPGKGTVTPIGNKSTYTSTTLGSSSSGPRSFKTAVKDEFRKFKSEVHKSTVDPHKSWEARYCKTPRLPSPTPSLTYR
ncbi:unnamed protein product [Clonostachys rhizophaga]|uniref:Uncharacterized protein n=1 Tax=Clonostachys rhizophaga TaxID=160324 RepID=A0A9N9YJ26_9HYPO|nr:unnamed protein product [Clonostachys rhizophaga]